MASLSLVFVIAVVILLFCISVVVMRRKASLSADQLRVSDAKLADAEQLISELRAQLTGKIDSILDYSSRLASAQAIAETLKHAPIRIGELESELEASRTAVQTLSAQLAAAVTERDSLKPLEAQLRDFSAKLERRNEELLAKSSEYATADTEKRSLQSNWEMANTRIQGLEEELRKASDRIELLVREQTELQTTLQGERKSADEQRDTFDHAEQRLTSVFDSLAHKALAEHTDRFVRLANETLEQKQQAGEKQLETKKDAIATLLHSLSSQLVALDQQIKIVETHHGTSEVKLEQQISSLVQLQHRLAEETRRLSKALERPTVRGSWGEIQLRRVAELAGMVEYCDFREQLTVRTEEGSRLRPDLLVTMPNNRMVAVDSKVSLEAYIKAANTDSEAEFKSLMEQHVAQIRAHITDLSSKSYWSQFANSPDLCVAFIPSEALYSAALQADPMLLDFAASRHILIATPTSLIALLRTIYYGWQEEKLAASAREVSVLGRRIYTRVVKLHEHLTRLGKSISSTVEYYNSIVGSIERGIFPPARRFTQLGAGTDKMLHPLDPVEGAPRPLQSPDWQQLAADDGDPPSALGAASE